MAIETNNINDVLERVKKMNIEDQIYISDIIYKRLIDKQRDKIADRVKEIRKSYKAGKTKSFNSFNDLWEDLNA